MRLLVLFSSVFLLQLSFLAAQGEGLTASDRAEIKAAEDTLGLFAYTVLNDSLEENRYAACRAMIPLLVNTLRTPNSFDYPFKRLSYLSIQYPPDSSFRIFTWQLFVDKDEYKYYGAIQMNTTELKLYPLIDRSAGISPVELEGRELAPDNWYGSVIYDILPVKHKTGDYFLLFGMDTYQAYRRRKLIDVLFFDETNGKPRFGKPVFVEAPSYEGAAPTLRMRLVQEYSAASYATLKYDPDLKLIMQENLITVSGNHGEGPVNVPDGSYVGYELNKDGRWHSIKKVYNHVYDEAPRTPRTETEASASRDLFGRRKHQ
jgi:hypothetical protein